MKMKQRTPALPNSPTFQQLWDALGSRLIETAQGNLFYTQEVRGSSPLPPTILQARINTPLLTKFLETRRQGLSARTIEFYEYYLAPFVKRYEITSDGIIVSCGP